ncbi:VacJ family lipoprotein [Sphingomonas sp. PB2P19]
MFILTMALLVAAPQTAPEPEYSKGIPSSKPQRDAEATVAVETDRAAERQAAARLGAVDIRDGDILVLGRDKKGDPLQGANVKAFGATQAVDDAVVGPVARTYKREVPSPIRRGIHNLLYNLKEPVIFLNFLLQFKPVKAAETAGRFAINSTIGIAGVLDVAKKKPFRLPRRANGFADTLGYHGVKNGPFLFLPIVGPTTVRDLLGGFVDRLLLPTTVGHPFTSPTYTAPLGVLGALDHRADFDETLKVLHDGSVDPYTASREFYLRRRQAEIDHLHGRDPVVPPPAVRTVSVEGAVEGPVVGAEVAPVASESVPETMTP